MAANLVTIGQNQMKTPSRYWPIAFGDYLDLLISGKLLLAFWSGLAHASPALRVLPQ